MTPLDLAAARRRAQERIRQQRFYQAHHEEILRRKAWKRMLKQLARYDGPRGRGCWVEK